MPDDATTWKLIHAERARLADALEALSPADWAKPSLCAPWDVRTTAAHILLSAEQTPGAFFSHMAANGFRFNRMIARDTEKLAATAPAEMVARLRARTSTKNKAPAPTMAMLGEAVVHGQDIFYALGRPGGVDAEASRACLDMYKTASFPVGGKKRIAGLKLVADDVDWTHGDGPEVRGPAIPLMLAVCGRKGTTGDLTGDGVATFAGRVG